MNTSLDTIDLSRKSLKLIDHNWRDDDDIETLILDENELSGLESIGLIQSLKSLSVVKNRIRRMSSLPHLANLCSLDLSKNSIVCIEGLKNVKFLKHLNLSGNYIKIIDHLNSNLELEHLDVSDNAIGHVTDLSFLTNLKELFLHKNHLSHLRNCEKNLPTSLEVLTLSDNSIADLTEISRLESLANLRELTMLGNPCLECPQGRPNFNYRPFLKIWCLNLSVIDGLALDPLESLKSEWLYSQGRGRRFRPGEHTALVDYLSSVCPMNEKSMNGEEEKKLRLILSKAEQHQQQLKEQIATGTMGSKKQKGGVPERMVSSYHDTVTRDSVCASPDVMTRSLDCSVLRNSPPGRRSPAQVGVTSGSPLQTATTLVPVPESLISPDVCRPLHPYMVPPPNRNLRSPLTISNRTSSPQSTPRTYRRTQLSGSPSPGRRAPSPAGSPKASPTKIASRKTHPPVSDVTDSDDLDILSPKKLHNIQARASQKRHKETQKQVSPSHAAIGKSSAEKKAKVTNSRQLDTADLAVGSDVWRAALCIQRRWRGYRVRNLDPKVLNICRSIQANRMQDYIIKVAADMEATKAALEGNRKLQVLQMQAINAMWRKLSSSEVDGLTASCLHLTKQVEELRGLVSGLHAGGQHPPAVPIATQTDIVAVHTPQGDATFPHLTGRPSHLALSGKPETDLTENTHKVPVEEDICWTPACQEGKDLQSIKTSVPSNEA